MESVFLGDVMGGIDKWASISIMIGWIQIEWIVGRLKRLAVDKSLEG